MLAELRGRLEEERALRQATELRARRLEVRALAGERASHVQELHVALESALEASKWHRETHTDTLQAQEHEEEGFTVKLPWGGAHPVRGNSYMFS